MTEQEHKDYLNSDEYKMECNCLDAMREHDNEEYRKQDECLEQVKAKVFKEVYNDILDLIEESEFTNDFKIVEKPKGIFENSDFEYLKSYFVNQTCNGGYSGDEFAGTISVPFDNKYLEFSYSM